MPRLGDYLQIQEAADYLGICRKTLCNWVAKGKIVFHRHPINGYRLFRMKDLDSLVEQTKKSAAKSRHKPR